MSESTLSPMHAASGAIERRFVGWDRPLLPITAAQLAAEYAEGDELRMSRVAVVLPGARAGRRLKVLLVDEAERLRLRLVPPRIVTVGALPELVRPLDRPVAGEVLAGRAWARALAGLPPERLARLFAAAPEAGDARGWGRLARIVAALHREVGGAGLRFAQVGERCAEGLLFADTERWSVLAEAQAAYEAELHSLGLVDRELGRIDALAGSGGLSPDLDLWIVGVVEMPGIARRMLESISPGSRAVRVLVQAPGEESGAFDALGCIRPEAWTARPIPLRDEQIAVRAGPAEQAGEVVRELSLLDGRHSAEEIVVGAADPELLPYLEESLESAGVAVHVSAGLPVERSGVARLLAAFADYLDGARFEACAALARHPDLAGWLRRVGAFQDEGGWVDALDRYLAECLPARLQGGVIEGARGAREVEALCRALDGERLLGRMRGRKPVSAWAPEILALLAEVYADAAPDPGASAGRRLIDACEYLRDVADELYRLPSTLDVTCDAATAIRILLDEAQGKALTPDPERGAVDLLGWLELRLDDAPVAIVTGFNEPFLPESTNAHPFLPNALRERLGLVDNAARYARDAYELTALLRSRQTVRVVAGRRSATGDPLRPSRLMFAVEGPALAERVVRFYADDPSSHPTAAAPNEAGGGRFAMPAEPLLRAGEPVEVLRVTDFHRLLQDPYGFALERVLRLEARDDAAREMDGLRFGNLAHEVLEAFARAPEISSTDEEAVRRRLDSILDETVLARFGRRAFPAVGVQTEQLRARLHAFARWQAGWVADGWRVVGAECSTPEGGVPFDVDGEPIRITGRIDRIDHHAGTGRWALLDYKTGDEGREPEKTHRAGRGEARDWIDLQLPLYRHLLPHLLDAEGNPFYTPRGGDEIVLGYLLLPRQLAAVGLKAAEWGDEELASADECAREAVRLLRRNEFHFDPASAKAYRKTPFAPILGIGYLESAAVEDPDAEEGE